MIAWLKTLLLSVLVMAGLKTKQLPQALNNPFEENIPVVEAPAVDHQVPGYLDLTPTPESVQDQAESSTGDPSAQSENSQTPDTIKTPALNASSNKTIKGVAQVAIDKSPVLEPAPSPTPCSSDISMETASNREAMCQTGPKHIVKLLPTPTPKLNPDPKPLPDPTLKPIGPLYPNDPPYDPCLPPQPLQDPSTPRNSLALIVSCAQ